LVETLKYQGLQHMREIFTHLILSLLRLPVPPPRHIQLERKIYC